MKAKMTIAAALAVVLTGGAYCATPEELGLTRIDITKAVRDAGAGMHSVSANINFHNTYTLEMAFDGSALKSSSADWAFSAVDNVTNAIASGGVEIVYEISSSYETGNYVIVDGYSIMNGSGQTQARNRLPSSWTFQGYDESSSSWTTLDSYADFTGWGDLTYGGSEQFGANFHFLNSTPYRKYRLVITKQVWDTMGIDPSLDKYKYNVCALLLSEIQLFGYVADSVPAIGGDKVDLTSYVRSTDGSFGTIASNMKQNNSYPLSNLVDGNGADFYFSAQADVATAYAAGGGYIEYDVSERFAHGSDIVVTGYSIMAPTNTPINYPLYRMPCDWKFQGYNESASEWNTLDEYSGFKAWDKFDFDGTGQYGFDFSFTNSVPYRKYRLLITRQCYDWYGIPADSGAGGMRLGEIRLFGYVGIGIAGTVGLDKPQFAFDYPEWEKLTDNIGTYGRRYLFDPIVSNSTCYSESTGATKLFNGDEADRLFCYLTDGDLPFGIYFSITNGEFLLEKDLVLTNYTLEVATTWGQYASRVPLSWTFEAYGDDRWIKLDTQNNFSGWTMESGLYKATFAIPEEKTFSATQYRLVIKSIVPNTTQKDGIDTTVLQLSEVKLDGTWGVGIANRTPNRPGLSIIFR